MGHLWKHSHMVFNVDNTAIVYALSSGTNLNTSIMNVIQMIAIGFSYSSSWFSSDENWMADSASHFQYNWLFSATPYL